MNEKDYENEYPEGRNFFIFHNFILENSGSEMAIEEAAGRDEELKQKMTVKIKKWRIKDIFQDIYYNNQ